MYFAYGSNLDRTQMASRCPHARFLRTTYIAGWALEFAGYSGTRRGPVATIVRAPGSVVWGALYRMTPSDWHRLDRVEGSAYTRMEVGAGAAVAQTYVMSAEPGIPPLAYLAQIYRAYLALGLPEAALAPWLTKSVQRGDIIKDFRSRRDVLHILAHLRRELVCQNGGMRGRKSNLTKKVYEQPDVARATLLTELISQDGNITATAKALAIGRRTLYRYIEHFNLQPRIRDMRR